LGEGHFNYPLFGPCLPNPAFLCLESFGFRRLENQLRITTYSAKF
jgi:hypothetical protein